MQTFFLVRYVSTVRKFLKYAFIQMLNVLYRTTILASRSAFKNYFVIVHLEKKSAVKAQQMLDLPIRKRKLRKLKKIVIPQRKLRKS